jgi:hypothetical protein
VYNNAFNNLELFTALLAKGYPQPAIQRLHTDMNALPLVRYANLDCDDDARVTIFDPSDS